MAGAYLGQSGQAMNFLAPDGNIYESNPNMLSQDTMGQMAQVPGLTAPAIDVPQPVAQPMMTDEPPAMTANNLIDNNQIIRQATQAGMTVPEYMKSLQASNDPYAGLSNLAGKSTSDASSQGQGQLGADQLKTYGQKNPVGQQLSADEQMLAQMSDAFKGQKGAVYQNIAAANEYAKASRQAFDDAKIEYGKIATDYEADRNAIKGEMDSKNLAIEDAKQAYLGGKVDQNKFWSDIGTGGKIGAAISMALSGIGMAIAGKPGENPAFNTIMGMIDRDVQLQKEDLKKAGTVYEMERTALGDLYRRLGDVDQAAALKRQLNIQDAELKIKAALGQAQNQQAVAQGIEMLSKLEIEKMKATKELQSSILSKALTTRITGEGLSADSFNPMQLPEDLRKQAVRVGDKYKLAINPESAKQVNDQLPAYDGVNAKIDKILQLQAKYGTEILPTEAKGEINSLANQLLLDIKNSKQLGALDKGAKEVGEEIIGNPAGFFTGRAAAKLNALKKQTDLEKNRFLEQNVIGYKPVQSKPREGMYGGGYVSGGMVPGPQVVKGDHPKNDVVPIMASAGEVVIPKSLVFSSDQEILNFIKKARAGE